MNAHLLELATAGDQNAFRELVEPHRSELHLHCYRILGSIQDAEDALQETLLAAWRGLKGFERRASLRTWLYSVATSRALNMLRTAKRARQAELRMPPNVSLPEPTRRIEPVWLEPYPDVLLDADLEGPPGPEAVYEAKEAISLAFVTALQLLPARQRAVLILRDVLGFRALEVAGMLDSTEESVTSALKRARAKLEGRPRPEAAPPPDSPVERELVGRLTAAFEANDVDGIVALLADDVRLAMPPLPLEYIGRDEAARFYGVVASRPGRRRLAHTRANGQPALAFYSQDVEGAEYVASSLTVLTLASDRFVAIDRFDSGVLRHFGLPGILPN
ncbi:MAG TPA: RNA polymerase subunit sigma-70 [Actinomycetota bacterium]|nr:RNA polymerase subunit sigma-70 [Actinomycetota bacterium]